MDKLKLMAAMTRKFQRDGHDWATARGAAVQIVNELMGGVTFMDAHVSAYQARMRRLDGARKAAETRKRNARTHTFVLGADGLEYLGRGSAAVAECRRRASVASARYADDMAARRVLREEFGIYD